MTENTMSWKRNCCAPVLLALALVWSPLSVFGDIVIPEPRRIALVIGNADYEHRPILKNAANDAAAVGAALERLGFEVDRVENAGFTTMRHSLVTFAQDAARASHRGGVLFRSRRLDGRRQLPGTGGLSRR